MSLALTLQLTISKISGISSDNQVRFIESYLGCHECKWLFTALEVVKNIFVNDLPDSGSEQLLKVLKIGEPDEGPNEKPDDVSDEGPSKGLEEESEGEVAELGKELEQLGK